MKLFRRWFTWPRAVAACALLPAILLGLWGFYIDRTQADPEETGSIWFWLAILYSTLQLFVMEFNVQNPAFPLPWQLHVARLLAALFLGLAIWEALTQLFQDQWRQWRLARLRGHAIVCGLGRKGLLLVQGLRARKLPVVVIELSETNDHLNTCRALGVFVIIGDATDKALLARAGISRAASVVVTSQSDRVNLKIALRAKESLSASSRPREQPLRCLVHVSQWEIAEVFRQHGILTSPDQQFDAQLVSYFEDSARHALAAAPLDLFPPSAQRGTPRRVRLVIVDFGPMGQALALQALRVGHFAGGQAVEITVLDPASEVRQREFRAHYPQLASAGKLSFVQQSMDDSDIRRQLVEWALEKETHLAVAICRDDDIFSLALALSLPAEVRQQPTTIYIWQNEPQDLDQILTGAKESGAQFIPFGAPEPSVSVETVVEDRLDRLARAIHEDYLSARRSDGSYNPADPAHQEWPYLGQGFRISCRAQADHIDVKLRAVGCRRVKHAQMEQHVTAFSPHEVELLAEMEHARWCTERFLAGWSVGLPKNKARKITPDLVPWRELPEPIREYDREAVRRIPEHLKMLGEEIERETWPPAAASIALAGAP